jgi:GDP-L-fucose synthase
MIDKTIKIYIAGHKGMVGNAIYRNLTSKGYVNIVFKNFSQLDLRNTSEVFEFFSKEKPDWIFLAAAKVGGIYANSAYPVEFLLDNLKIQNNIIEASHKYGSKKLLFLGSSCIYPRLAIQPIKEECLLSSKLEPTNESYAIAKITGIKLCSAMNRQYGTNFISVMPTNLYGINDNYHNENAHVIPMLIRRFHEAKLNNYDHVKIWGTGMAKREFLFADDLADACVFIMEKLNASDIGEIINIGSGKECTILELAHLIKEIVEFSGEIRLDPTKPDGTPRKLLDVSRMTSFGWSYKTELKDGLKIIYKDFLNNKNLRL